jgi:hypothetical protein
VSGPETTISLYGEQQESAFRNAISAVREERDEDLTQGEVVLELSRAYTGWEGESA